MSSAILRQWHVLALIPRAPRKVDTAALSAQLRERGIVIHRRTIQRDLVELSQVFPLIADDRAKPYGWRWSDESVAFDIPPPTLREPEIVVRGPPHRLRAAIDPLRRFLADLAGDLELALRSH